MLAKKDSKKFSDAQTKKRIHEHLSNKNDRISEEDINNVKTNIAEGDDIGSIYSTNKENLSEDKPVADSAEDKERANDSRIETSWNMPDE